jgi:hypothetical protein
MQDDIASSLQSIETALFLIGQNRWPTVIMLLFKAIEQLLKHDLKRKKTSEKLINLFSEKYDLPDELKVNAHNLRNLRNEITHRGYSPRDDDEIIMATFNYAIPFLDAIFIKTFEDSVFDLIAKGTGQEWIANTYKKTLKLVRKKTDLKDPNLSAALLQLKIVFRRIERTSNAHTDVFSGSAQDEILSEEYQDVAYEIERKLYSNFLNALKTNIIKINYDLLLHIPNLKCLNCAQDKVVGAVSFHSDESFNKVMAFGCYQCEYSIWDDDVCDVFVNEILDQEQIEIMQDPETPDASASLGIDFLM